MCEDVFEVTEVENAVVVSLADAAAVVTEAEVNEVEVEPMPFAANSDFTRLKYVKSG